MWLLSVLVFGNYISSNSMFVLEFQCSNCKIIWVSLLKRISTLLVQIAFLDDSVLNIAVALEFQFYNFAYSIRRMLGWLGDENCNSTSVSLIKLQTMLGTAVPAIFGVRNRHDYRPLPNLGQFRLHRTRERMGCDATAASWLTWQRRWLDVNTTAAARQWGGGGSVGCNAAMAAEAPLDVTRRWRRRFDGDAVAAAR